MNFCQLAKKKGVIMNVFNQLNLYGYVSSEIRQSEFGDGVKVAQFTLSVKRPYKKNGETFYDHLPITAYNKRAEKVLSELAKGDFVIFSGYVVTKGNKENALSIVLMDFSPAYKASITHKGNG